MSAGVHLDWGVAGARRLPSTITVAVVVDVLSFTTTLGVACERGITVLPYRYAHDSARRYADEHDAVLARRRADATTSDITLSPNSVRVCAVPPARLVLPSPNGSTVAHLLALPSRSVMAASLRNADAVAARLVDLHPDAEIVVIAAGERWDDDSLRPAVEDLWGAGAVLAGLVRRGRTDLSPEAWAGVHAWHGVGDDAPQALHDTVSGRELHAMGYPDDVRIAGETATSTVVPVMDGATFVSA